MITGPPTSAEGDGVLVTTGHNLAGRRERYWPLATLPTCDSTGSKRPVAFAKNLPSGLLISGSQKRRQTSPCCAAAVQKPAVRGCSDLEFGSDTRRPRLAGPSAEWLQESARARSTAKGG